MLNAQSVFPFGHTRLRQRGASMIELLVALVIFAFGMLGLAGLQSRTMEFSQSSLYRSQATALTDDVLDRMRADRANAANGLWDTATTDDASSITGTNLYQVDLKDWKKQVETLLPQGKASISRSGGVLTVRIEWDDSRGRDSAQQMDTQTRL